MPDSSALVAARSPSARQAKSPGPTGLFDPSNLYPKNSLLSASRRRVRPGRTAPPAGVVDVQKLPGGPPEIPGIDARHQMGTRLRQQQCSTTEVEAQRHQGVPLPLGQFHVDDRWQVALDLRDVLGQQLRGAIRGDAHPRLHAASVAPSDGPHPGRAAIGFEPQRLEAF